jgi:hypothetical protein
MELLYTERPDAFALASSDADFTPLVMHLRAKGAAVYGFGAAQTPKPFVNACSRFLYLEALRETSAASEAVPDAAAQPAKAAGLPCEHLRVPTAQLRQNSRLMGGLRAAVLANADEDGWVRVGALGHQIANKESFDARNYGYGSLSKLLAATEAFEFRDEGTPRVAVRVRGRRPASP